MKRRDLIKATALAGLGALPAQGAPRDGFTYEADVVVVGAGASGLVTAIRARDAGLSVIVIDQNFDVGGKMLDSGGWVSLGGGDPFQTRDIAGETDAEGFITVPPFHKPEDLTEDADFLFADITDWSVLDQAAQAPYRYNERGLHRAWADNTHATGVFLTQNYVRLTRVWGTHATGGVSRARRTGAFLRLGERTDIEAGFVTRADAGIEAVSSSHFSPRLMIDASEIAAPGTVTGGAALSRGLEWSARKKGVRFLLNRRMDELIREQPFAGQVIGIGAGYSPRLHPETGERLESYWRNGNIDDRREHLRIRARKAVMIASSGHSGNPQFRGMFYPAFRDPAYGNSALALLGSRGQDASGIIAGLRIGAGLAGMQQNQGIGATFHLPRLLGTRDAYNQMLPGHPAFVFRKAAGLMVKPEHFRHLIVVNQVGRRFYNEVDLTRPYGSPIWPGGPKSGVPHASPEHVQGDWRNASPEWVRQSYDRHPGIDAAVAINEGSQAPDYHSGLLWVIFDDAAVKRAGLDISAPFLTDNGYYFTGTDADDLARKIEAGCEYQRVPLRYLSDTLARWNGFAQAGVDTDFGREKDGTLHPVGPGRLHAAVLCPIWHDSYGGLRINGKAQVVNTEGEVIPGLYAGGEASGGGSLHGLGRALVHGFIAATAIVGTQA